MLTDYNWYSISCNYRDLCVIYELLLPFPQTFFLFVPHYLFCGILYFFRITFTIINTTDLKKCDIPPILICIFNLEVLLQLLLLKIIDKIVINVNNDIEKTR